MKLKPDKRSKENRKFWEHVNKTAEKVRHWPTWMGGEGKQSKECPHCYGCGYITEVPES